MTKKLPKAISILIILNILSSCNSQSVFKHNSYANPNILSVHYINVGQGDSELIQINNKNLLIDAGPTDAENKVLSYLDEHGVKTLDYVVATHPHEDHIGGMSKVIKHFKIKNFICPKTVQIQTTPSFRAMINALKVNNIKIQQPIPGEGLNLGKDINCLILAPNSSYYEDLNNYSIVIKITYGNTRFLFEGDASELSEQEMIAAGDNLSADVLKVGHHGSKSATSPEFLKEVSPKVAIISCGLNNDYHHPHKITLDKLKEVHCKIYRTDLNGDINLISNKKKIMKINH